MKKINKIVTSGIMLGMLAPLSPLTALAKDDPDASYYDTYGNQITKSDELFSECQTDSETYLAEYNGGFYCLVKKENSKLWNSTKDKSDYQSRKGIYYLQGDGLAPIQIMGENDREGGFTLGNKFAFDKFLSSNDFGKKVQIELEVHNAERNDSDSGMLMSKSEPIVYTSKDSESNRNPERENSSIFSNISMTYDGFSDGVLKEVSEGTLNGDNLETSISSYISLHPNKAYMEEASQWKSFDDVKLTKNTPYLSAKLTVGGQVRFNGPVAAFLVVPDSISEQTKNELQLDKKDETQFMTSLGIPSVSPTTPEMKAKLIKNINMFDDFYFPVPVNHDKQGFKANVLNGGITGGIVSPEVGKDLSIEDIDFGKLSIGQTIESVKKDSMVSVRDWTGGNGWKLTAQHKNTDRNQSLQLGVQVDKGKQVDLNNEANLVTEGDSQLDTTVLSGEYSAKWGTHPTVGEFNNVIEWNLSANVTE